MGKYKHIYMHKFVYVDIFIRTVGRMGMYHSGSIL